MKKIIIFALIASLFAIFVSAEQTYVYDNADIFGHYEESRIDKKAGEVYEDKGLLCVIVTDYDVGIISNSEMSIYAGDASDMLLLVVDMDAREFDLYQYNDTNDQSKFKISSLESDKILDVVYEHMANGDYADAALVFISESERFYTDSFDFGKLFIFFVAGCAIGGIAVLIVRATYKNKVHGSIYPLSQYSSLNLTESNDVFVNKSVIVTRIPDPPSSSGSGGGGGGVRMGGRKF